MNNDREEKERRKILRQAEIVGFELTEDRIWAIQNSTMSRKELSELTGLKPSAISKIRKWVI